MNLFDLCLQAGEAAIAGERAAHQVRLVRTAARIHGDCQAAALYAVPAYDFAREAAHHGLAVLAAVDGENATEDDGGPAFLLSPAGQQSKGEDSVAFSAFVDGAGECGVEGHAAPGERGNARQIPKVPGVGAAADSRGQLPLERAIAGIKSGHSPAAFTYIAEAHERARRDVGGTRACGVEGHAGEWEGARTFAVGSERQEWHRTPEHGPSATPAVGRCGAVGSAGIKPGHARVAPDVSLPACASQAPPITPNGSDDHAGAVLPCARCGHDTHLPGCCRAWKAVIDFKGLGRSGIWGCECEAPDEVGA